MTGLWKNKHTLKYYLLDFYLTACPRTGAAFEHAVSLHQKYKKIVLESVCFYFDLCFGFFCSPGMPIMYCTVEYFEHSDL